MRDLPIIEEACVRTSSSVTPEIAQFIQESRVARLATVDSESKPHVVPVVFVFDGSDFFIPIDNKKKKSSDEPCKLKRVRNINENPNVALLIDTYSEDWTRLAFVIVQGKASIADKERGNVQLNAAYKHLAKKYPQYQNVSIGNTCIVIRPDRVLSWKNTGE